LRDSIKNFYLGLKFSLSYFSIIPVRFKSSDDLSSKGILKWMLLFFPFIGLILSLLSISFVNFGDSWLMAIFGAVFYMVGYGFLHTEAIIDVVDALFAKHSGKDPYKIIKDSTVGAMGVLFGVAFVILKLASLVSLFLEQKALWLILIAISSRLGALTIFRAFEFRSSFLTILKESFSSFSLFLALTFYSLFILTLFGWSGVAILAILIILSLIVSEIIGRRLGFLNGDVVGTTIELVELFGLILVVNL